MRSKNGIEIESIQSGSPAEKSGLLPGDILISLNAHTVHDPIDFMFYSAEKVIKIKLKRGKEIIPVSVTKEEGKEIGVAFKPLKVMTCKNNCIFCFVKQLPKGLRKTLYLRDEDYRMSFLYGNYITLSNLGRENKKRIVEQRLSPLYISVHTTNRTLRNRLLGNAKAPDILEELKFFAGNKIRLHTQIVLCPDYNDGKELYRTISDLYRFYPYVVSIAVVPVGLTSCRENTIRPVEKEDARDALKIIESFQKRFRKKHGHSIVYGADEFYIKSELSFPPLKEYGDMPQIENGVGMVPLFMSRAKKLKVPKSASRKKRFITFTGLSFYPFLKKFIERLSSKEGLTIEAQPVENRFFGPSITVTGLLTGRDIIRALSDRIDAHEIVLVPDVVLRNGEDVFLDNLTPRDMEEALGVPVRTIEATPEGLLKGTEERE
jgi:putative radical SAM enzyme (TIGR03279 family)